MPLYTFCLSTQYALIYSQKKKPFQLVKIVSWRWLLPYAVCIYMLHTFFLSFSFIFPHLWTSTSFCFAQNGYLYIFFFCYLLLRHRISMGNKVWIWFWYEEKKENKTRNKKRFEITFHGFQFFLLCCWCCSSSLIFLFVLLLLLWFSNVPFNEIFSLSVLKDWWERRRRQWTTEITDNIRLETDCLKK